MLYVVPIIGYIVINLLKLSCKNRFFIDKEIKDEPYIIAFWHGELLMAPFLYKKIRTKPNISVMISEHFDGEIISRLIAFFGFDSLRGSSSKGAKRVLLGAINAIKDGKDIGITPDGPRGPRYSVADGIVAISQKTDAKIVVFRIKANRYWELKSWDRFMIPKFFSTIEYHALAPFSINSLDLQTAKEQIRNRMLSYE